MGMKEVDKKMVPNTIFFSFLHGIQKVKELKNTLKTTLPENGKIDPKAIEN